LQSIDECFDLQVRDNLPIVTEGRYGTCRKPTCDFCKEKHDVQIEHCDLEVMGLDTSNSIIASKVTLQNILD
jgi:hypothetical protein